MNQIIMGRNTIAGLETFVVGGAKLSFEIVMKKPFANGEQGFWYDPNDLTTMWQDQAKLLPVTGEGQPVWHILDKSGNNNHAFATSSATRPILRKNAVTGAYYLEFDGTDDFLQTAVSLPFPVTAVAPFNFKSGANIKCVLSAGITGYLRSTENTASVHTTAGSGSIAKKKVDVLLHELTGDSVNIRSNADAIMMRDLETAVRNPYVTVPKYIGSFSDTHTALRSAMDLYGLIMVRKLLSTSEEAELRNHFNKRMGI